MLHYIFNSQSDALLQRRDAVLCFINSNWSLLQPEGASASKGVEIGQQVNVTVPTMTPTPTTVSSTSQRFIMDNFDTDSNNTRESRESKNFATPDPEDMEFTDNYAINITGLNKNERDRMRSLFLNILMTRNGSDYNGKIVSSFRNAEWIIFPHCAFPQTCYSTILPQMFVNIATFDLVTLWH